MTQSGASPPMVTCLATAETITFTVAGYAVAHPVLDGLRVKLPERAVPFTDGAGHGQPLSAIPAMNVM